MRTLKIRQRFAKTTEALGDAELGRLFRGMLKYAFSGEDPQLCGSEKVLWPDIRQDIDQQMVGYQNKVAGAEKARSLISVRYQSDISLISADISLKREKEETEEKTKKNSFPLEPPIKEKVKREEKEEKEKRVRKQFVPPTLDDVRAYVAERNSPVDPVAFWEYFDTGHWKDSEGKPVISWKQKLLTWEKHQNGRGRRNGTERDPGRDQTGSSQVSPWGNLYSNKS